MRIQRTVGCIRAQRGVALAVSLLLLLLLTMIGVTAMRSSIFELQMARNEVSRITAFERAQSLIDAIISDTTNLVGSDRGDTNCTASWPEACTQDSVDIDNALLVAPHGDRSSAQVTYLNCLDSVPRRLNVSEDEFDSAQFEVEARYDATADRQGRSALAQGVLVMIRQGPQGACP